MPEVRAVPTSISAPSFGPPGIDQLMNDEQVSLSSRCQQEPAEAVWKRRTTDNEH
jgi:hypothetical protein